MASKTRTKQNMPKDDFKKATPEVIVTRHDELWVFVKEYLEMLYHSSARCDIGFANRFEQLLDYVYSKIELPIIGGDVIDSCFVVWQKVDDKHSNCLKN